MASADVVDLVASPLRVLRAVNVISSSRPRPRSAWPRPGCSQPARARLRCCRRSAASWPQRPGGYPGQLHHGVRRPQAAGRAAADHGHGRAGPARHAPAHPHHHLHRRDRGARAGRAGAPAGLRSARVARRPAHAPACQGLAVPAQDRLWLGLCRQRQPVGCGADRRAGVDRQADPARAGGAVRSGRGPLRDAVGRQRVPAL